MIKIPQIAEKRTVLGEGGNVREYLDGEFSANELMKQLLSPALYNGGNIDKYELLDNSYRASGGYETGDYLIPHPSELAYIS